jgi:photosystem II stability/assembly factor-like uncharacterized protein
MKRSTGITAVIALVAILAVGSAWAITNSNSSPDNNSSMMGDSSQFHSVSADRGMEHIHNLMLTDKELVIGTHQGLWSQMSGKAATRIGNSHFDVMGLAMVNGMMVTSGHPGVGEQNVNNLGFQMSMNGGMAWDNTSLMGKVDFHRLVASGNAVMGISAGDGALMRSEDAGRTWTTLTNPGLYDIAMDQTDSTMVIGTTQSGPVISIDGGKSFKAIPNAPIVGLVSWDKARLVGVTPVGVVYQSLDMGSTWKKLATIPGEPMALTVKGDQIAILAGTTVYYSTDAGITFKERIVGVSGH